MTEFATQDGQTLHRPPDGEVCQAKIRMFRPINETELVCELSVAHEFHRSVLRDYACPGSATTVEWENNDRRNFAGDFIECPTTKCILPIYHRGDHVIV